MSVQYNYNQTGARRKALVETIAKILGEPAVYCKAPTFSYNIGFCRVDRNGVLSCPEGTAPEKVNQLIRELREQGYMAENATEADAAKNMENIRTDIGTHPFTITVPNIGFSKEKHTNLLKIIASKEKLLKKALGVEQLYPIHITDEEIRFPWFTLYGVDGEADAYARLVSAICKMAKERTRVTAKECDDGNDKFSMRLFLIQLGFIGDEFKTARKVLLRNLAGNSSWKSGCDPRRAVKAAIIPDAPEDKETLAEKQLEALPDGGRNEPPIIPPVQYAMKKPGDEPYEE